MDLQTKAFGVLDFEVKSLTLDEENEDDPNGSFHVILSAPTKDREGEVVDAKCFEPLPDHITFDTDHGLSVATTVGSGIPTYEGDLLHVKGTFTSLQRGQDVRTLVREGHIRTVSASFLNGQRERDDKGIPHVRKAELVNGTFCSVPVNREALVLAAKSLGVKAGARNNANDANRLQQIHDLAVENGASCSGSTKSLRRVSTKAVAGSYEDRQEDITEALVEISEDAIRVAFPDADPGDYSWRVCIIATFDDRVVYRIGWDDDDAWQVTYTWDGETVTITGEPEAVEVDQVVTPVQGDAPSTPATPTKALKTATTPVTAPAPAAKAVGAAVGAGGDGQAQDPGEQDELSAYLADIDAAVAAATAA